MEIGIVGLPSAGKSTLFNALTKAGAQVGNFPFTTIDKNVGIVPVPDARLENLAKIFNPQKVTSATIRFTDIAGLVKGASKGEGLGNMFLSHIREVDVVAHVVRAFSDSNVVHVEGSLNPENDVATINTELLLADIQAIERREEKLLKEAKARPKQFEIELQTLRELKDFLDKGQPVRNYDKADVVAHLSLLTAKPVIYVANVDEGCADGECDEYMKIKRISEKEGAESVAVCAKIEAELAELEASEIADYLVAAGIEEPGLNKLIRTSYHLLDLITFFTVGEKECRAWSIKKGLTAQKAAGNIHSDFEKGFIRAEVISYESLIKAGSVSKAKEMGLIRIEGRDYIVKDGDCMTIRFNV